MTWADVSESGRVDVGTDIDVPLTAGTVWGQMRDFARFTTLDPFHARMRIGGGRPQAGSSLVIEHRFAGVGVDRIGRILRWREGVGYAFSDLSKRSTQVGFPHVYVYAVSATGPGTSTVRVTVRGRWTARWLPRAVIRLWLRWVLSYTAASIRTEMLLYAHCLPAKRQAAPVAHSGRCQRRRSSSSSYGAGGAEMGSPPKTGR